MADQTDLVINDGQATPVAKTFSVRGADMSLAIWKDISGGIAIGTPTVTLSNKDSESQTGSYKTELRITVPVLETISGDAGGYAAVPKVAYKMFGKVELVAPNRATLQNRKDIFAFVANALANAQIKGSFVDFNPPN